MNSIVFNGDIIAEDKKIAGAANRGLRYGDGLFETMKLINGKIPLESFHKERLFNGLDLMKFNIAGSFDWLKVVEEAKELCKINNCFKYARVRLMMFRDEDALKEGGSGKLNYVIEAKPLDLSSLSYNEKGLTIGVYGDIRKSCDGFSNLKSSNFLPYVMGAMAAKENGWNDSIVLNSAGRISDCTIANIFFVKNENVFTPALSEGCVAGVMRKYLVPEMREGGYNVLESEFTIDDISRADEIFLTNAVYGIRWVKHFNGKIYSNRLSGLFFNRFIEPLNIG